MIRFKKLKAKAFIVLIVTSASAPGAVCQNLAYKDTAILQEVTFTNDRVHSVRMGEERVTALEAKNLPAVLGEVDIIKVLQLKPGVKSAGEGMAGFYVRGGGADQNLVRLDGIPIYNANHLLGLFSIFNNDGVQEAKLYKSAYPAAYGGRLSSVLDVTSKKAAMDTASYGGGIGLLSSRLFAATPLKKGKSSIIVCARRTYLDLITNPINHANKDREKYKPIPSYYFTEFNVRSDWKINKHNSAWATAYRGSDHFNSLSKSYPANFGWGNTGASVNLKSQVTEENLATEFFLLFGIQV